jgi:hypothetical protein
MRGPVQPVGHFPHFELSSGHFLPDPECRASDCRLYQALKVTRVYMTANVQRALI